MASPNNPKSSAQLIREHSRARVIVPSHKRFITGHNPLTKQPEFSRQLTGQDVVESMVRAYR